MYNHEKNYDPNGLAHAKFVTDLGADKPDWWPFLGVHMLPCKFGPKHGKKDAVRQAEEFKNRLIIV